MRLGDRVGTYLIRNSVHSLATSSRVAASRMHGNATGRSRDGRGEGGEGSARYCVREREDRDGERGRRERGIKGARGPRTSCYVLKERSNSDAKRGARSVNEDPREERRRRGGAVRWCERGIAWALSARSRGTRGARKRERKG